MLWMVVATGSCFADDPAPSNHWFHVEQYSYSTVDEKTPDTVLEQVTMQFFAGTHEQQTAYTSRNQEGTEQTRIRLTPEGKLLSGIRRNSDTNGIQVSSARIWIEAGQILSEVTRDGREPKLRSSPQEGADVAAEPSLMNMLRVFPFGAGEERKILMATFSQYIIPMTIRQLEDERASVPAGLIDCYKLEATVSFFGLKFNTTYWLSKDPPHILIRYRGKRGLFLSPTYVTELVSGETNGVPLRLSGSGHSRGQKAQSGAPIQE
jgi:hypothetical protein